MKWLTLIALALLTVAVLAIQLIEKKDQIGLVLMHGKGGGAIGAYRRFGR